MKQLNIAALMSRFIINYWGYWLIWRRFVIVWVATLPHCNKNGSR